MIKAKELLGRSVVDLTSGEWVDSVRDVALDHQTGMVLGLVVTEGKWLRRSNRVIPYTAVASVGEDAVMVGPVGGADDARLQELLGSDQNLIGMTLLTADGDDLGRIEDAVFDGQTGRVEGYVVSGGYLAT
ncbi:PRC-barrel domain-containing protein [Deinococcus lacus]|uniref:PRC-barrel domain-containing protein n=1 Tax=Deinococcus lacus TaxID=392561 RepID=A0ABW1YC88_9DEIO